MPAPTMATFLSIEICDVCHLVYGIPYKEEKNAKAQLPPWLRHPWGFIYFFFFKGTILLIQTSIILKEIYI